ncbi:hypothetical protein [Marivita hallyeonensis]|uniref:SnoaL-like domain-containing protein n=1 Tax=Marivita hallyeonensis TaxID=996342 RepID=A0A1M5Y6D6_9RHOB|nr:hypothetical protein [Marivita hallyeonensis]SHI07645.1 hypothetical protein SAMN05443551_0124 [Marivita hallyeonensis]
MSQDSAAEEIADELLFKTGKALINGDFDGFGACFGVPHVIETSEGRRVIKDMEALRAVFDEVRRYHRDAGVIDVVRTIVEARFLDADTIGSTHVARPIQRNVETPRKPYPVYSIIRRHGHLDWKVVSSIYAILDSDEHNAILTAPPSKGTE